MRRLAVLVTVVTLMWVVIAAPTASATDLNTIPIQETGVVDWVSDGDTFRFIDTQARLSRQGMDAIFTHAILSGSNGVIDEKTFLPNANYWAALLWRKLVGTQILDAGPVRPGLHVYAHCLRGTTGGVTVMAINLEPTPAVLAAAGPAEVYSLTSPELTSRTVLLNGKPLAVRADDTLPDIVPVRNKGGQVGLPGHSVTFATFPQAGNRSCTSPL